MNGKLHLIALTPIASMCNGRWRIFLEQGVGKESDTKRKQTGKNATEASTPGKKIAWEFKSAKVSSRHGKIGTKVNSSYRS